MYYKIAHLKHLIEFVDFILQYYLLIKVAKPQVPAHKLKISIVQTETINIGRLFLGNIS